MSIFQTKKGISIYYEVMEPPISAIGTCVLIGGLTRDHTIWRKLAPQLAEQCRVVIFDNRDSGQSTCSNCEYEISDLADDVSDMIKTLNFSPAHIIGHSMGGFMGFHIASKYPELVQTLSLCSTAVKQVPAGIEYLTGRIKLIESQPTEKASTATREDILAVMEKLYAPTSLHKRELVEEIIKHETSNPYPQSMDSFRRQAIACVRHDATSLLKNIFCPTLIVTGEYDKYYTPDMAYKLATDFNQSSVSIIPNAAHMVQLEQPEILLSTLTKFLHENAKKNEPIIFGKIL